MQDFTTAAAGDHPADFDTAFDRLLLCIYFRSEKDSILEKNVQITKEAFSDFLDDMKWDTASWCFDELLKEKSGEYYYRADGKTPNWYHEFRETLSFLAKVRAGLLKQSDLEIFGGPEVMVGTIMRHDSWEDLDKSPVTHIFARMEAKIHALMDKNRISAEEGFKRRQNATQIITNVDILTRKTPKQDEEGQYERKPTGKIVKQDRFGGDLNIYYDRIVVSPFAVMAKFEDSIEGMATRVGVDSFSLEDDKKYTEERRNFYGTRAIDEEAIDKFPFMEDSIKSSDSMLGILLRTMETVNYYTPTDGAPYQNPMNAHPIRLKEYLPAATRGYNLLPPAWHPLCIFLERLEDKAVLEANRHTARLLDSAIYPALGNAFPKPHNYIDRSISGTTHLPPGAVYAPNMV